MLGLGTTPISAHVVRRLGPDDSPEIDLALEMPDETIDYENEVTMRLPQGSQTDILSSGSVVHAVVAVGRSMLHES